MAGQAAFHDGVKVTVNQLVVHTAMAFGNGAQGLNLTPAASRLLLGIFRRRFRHHLQHYAEHRLAIMAYATGLGWYTFTLANAKSNAIIDVEEIKVGLDKFPCPIIPPVFNLLKELGEGFQN